MIVDSTFKDIQGSVVASNTDILVSNQPALLNTWRVKTTNGAVRCNVSKVPTGLRIDALYPGIGYIYIRQVFDGVKLYEGKKYKLIVKTVRDSWQPLNYDVYIASRYSSSDTNRVTCLDTPTKPLVRGSNTIEVEFDVPTEYGRHMDEVNGLSIAFRLIGNTQNTQCTINSMELAEVTEDLPSPGKLTTEQLCTAVTKLIQDNT